MCPKVNDQVFHTLGVPSVRDSWVFVCVSWFSDRPLVVHLVFGPLDIEKSGTETKNFEKKPRVAHIIYHFLTCNKNM